MPSHKALSGVEFKDAGHGQVEAVFATLNVVDHDGDVTLPGAFKSGAPVKISAYNHSSWQGALPVGKGRIFEEGDSVVFRGEFFDTTNAQDTRKTLAALGDMGEWSYGFDVDDSAPGEFKGKNVRFLKSMSVHEVSPVLMGAGIGTRTRSVKSADTLAEAVEAALETVERARRVEAIRAEKGLEMTGATRKSLEGLDEALTGLKALLNSDDTKSEETVEEKPTVDELTVEFLRFLQITQEGAENDE